MTEIQIAVLVFVGLVLFFVFLKIAVQGPPQTAPDSNAILAVRQMVHLHGLSFHGAQRFWDPAEFQMLRSTPELHQVTLIFRKERQALVLAWISLLLDDVHNLWRFRRFLVRNGVQAKLGEELQILQTAIGAVVFLNFLRIFVRIAGPFALAGAASRGRRLVERMSYASAGVLDRMPRAGWADVERDWQKSLA
jgi:hypothetical protein